MMKRFKRFLLLVAVLGSVSAAQAEVLRWLVGDNPVDGKDFGGGDQTINWTYAALRATTQSSSNAAIYQGTGSIQEKGLTDSYTTADASSGGSYLLQSQIGSDDSGDWMSVIHKSSFDPENDSYVWANLNDLIGAGLTTGDNPALSFYVELYDASKTLIGYSAAQTYTELANFRDVSDQVINWTSFNSWNAGDWTAVPEPTSGMLALRGLVALGLRRRRV